MTKQERQDVFDKMYQHIPAQNAADLRAVANGVFTICRDTEDMSDSELIQTLSLLNGMSCGVMRTAAELLEQHETN